MFSVILDFTGFPSTINAEFKIIFLRLLFVQRSYSEIFFKLWETVAFHLLKPKTKDLKNFTVKKFGQFLKALTVKLSVSRIKGLPTQRF